MKTALARPISQNCNHPRQSFLEKDAKCFFKIVLPSTIRDRQLEIPPKFVKIHGNELSDVAVLKVKCGNGWRVRLKKADGNVWLENGWQEFVQYHSICAGHFLMFRYDGNSQFHVHIFDLNASEVEYPRKFDKLDKPNQNIRCDLVPYQKEEGEEDSVEEGEIIDGYEDNPPIFPYTKEEWEEDAVEEGEIIDGYEGNLPMFPYQKDWEEDSLEEGEINDGYEGNPPILRCSDKLHVDSNSGKRSRTVCQNDTRYNRGHKSGRPREHATLKYDNHVEVVPIEIGGQESNQPILRCSDKLPAKSNLGKRSRSVCENAARYKRGIRSRKPRERAALKYDNQIEVVPIDYNSSSHEPTTSTPCRFLSNRGNIKKWHPTVKTKDDLKELVPYVRPLSTIYPTTDAVESQDMHAIKQGRDTPDCERHPNLRARVKRTISSRKNDKACQAANSFKSKNPFFMVFMRPTYVDNKYVLNVPFPFMQQYIGTENHDVTLVSNGRKWITRCHMYEDVRGAKLYSWGAFARGNDLKEEDVCIFEMIDPKKVVLKVSIF